MAKGAAFGKAAQLLEGSAKSLRDAVGGLAKGAKQSETVKSAGPALGKIATFAAYPVGVGAGIGVGTWAAGTGAASAIDATGTAVKKAWTPDDIKDAGMKFFGVLLLLVFVGVIVYLWKFAKGA